MGCETELGSNSPQLSLNPKTYIDDLRTPNPLHGRMQSRLWVLEKINLGFEATKTSVLVPLRKPDLTGRRTGFDGNTGARRSANIAHADVSSNALRISGSDHDGM